jgi:hypothetical protein
MSIAYSIVEGYKDIERVHSIESEREKIMSTTEFQNWCATMGIGSRVVQRDSRATELMRQYGDRYTQWLSKR